MQLGGVVAPSGVDQGNVHRFREKLVLKALRLVFKAYKLVLKAHRLVFKAQRLVYYST